MDDVRCVRRAKLPIGCVAALAGIKSSISLLECIFISIVYPGQSVPFCSGPIPAKGLLHFGKVLTTLYHKDWVTCCCLPVLSASAQIAGEPKKEIAARMAFSIPTSCSVREQTADGGKHEVYRRGHTFGGIDKSTVDAIVVVRHLPEMASQEDAPLCMQTKATVGQMHPFSLPAVGVSHDKRFHGGGEYREYACIVDPNPRALSIHCNIRPPYNLCTSTWINLGTITTSYLVD